MRIEELTLQMKATRPFETLIKISQSTGQNIPYDVNLQSVANVGRFLSTNINNYVSSGNYRAYINTLRTGSFKLFKRPFPGFLTILTL